MSKRPRIVLAAVGVWVASAGAWAWGCSSDDTAAPVTDAGIDSNPGTYDSYVAPQDAAADRHDASNADADLPYADVNGCSPDAGDAGYRYQDRSASGDNRVVQGPETGAAGAYDPSCMKIAKGQSVTFKSLFPEHPLVPDDAGGPNPIPYTIDGGSVTVAFPNAGVYGYRCGVSFHQQTMHGAIWVAP